MVEDYAEEIARLELMLDNVQDVSYQIESVLYGILAVCVLFVFIVSCKNDAFRDLPFKVKLSLVIFLVYQPIQIFVIAFRERQSKTVETVLFYILLGTWEANHWLFCNCYLHTATLFKVTLTAHSSVDFEKIDKKRRVLNIIEITGYIYIVITRIVTILMITNVPGPQFWWLATIGIQNAFEYLGMALITLFSMRKINNDSAQIKEMGVRSNNVLMCLYVIAWLSFDLCSWAFFIIWMGEVVDRDTDPVVGLRKAIAFFSLTIICYIFSFSLDLLILYSYLRHARKISERATNKLVDRLNQSFTESSTTEQEVEERAALSRRLSAYKDMADQQIK